MVGMNGYSGNSLLKGSGAPVNFTAHEISEFRKCYQDPLYFSMKYIKIVNIDEGLVAFEPYEYQKRMIRAFIDNRYVITKMPRQSGKSTAVVGYLLWKIIFHDYMKVAILAHKGSTARDLLGRVMLAYQHLPKWLQQGVVVWNKGNIELENGSTVRAESTSSSAIRGFSFNLVFLDEFAFIPTNIADEFFNSVYPTITSGKNSQCIIVSTPKGMNHYYKMWENAVNKNNDYVPIEVHWSEVPGRDEQWKLDTIRATSEAQFAQEFECLFMGGANTLISPTVLSAIPWVKPIETNGSIDVFEFPLPKHTYVCCVDVARGVEKDYSAFTITDVTSLPYKIVCKYRSRSISPALFPNIIHNIVKKYNHAYCLVEINDIGGQVADVLLDDFEYDNMITTTSANFKGQHVSGGFGKNTQVGIRTTSKTKNLGCSHLKTIIESGNLIINDLDIIEELTTFIEQKKTFAAEEGSNDDLVMTLVLLSWLINEQFFKDLMNLNIRERIQNANLSKIEDEMTPFGLIDDHNNYEEEYTPSDFDSPFWVRD